MIWVEAVTYIVLFGVLTEQVVETADIVAVQLPDEESVAGYPIAITLPDGTVVEGFWSLN